MVTGGSFPFRYLGVPISSKKLKHQDCQPSLDKFISKLSGWKSHFLSNAGHVELIQSTLSTLHLFWATVFLLPKSVLHTIERYIRNFFWNAGTSHCFHPVAWESIRKPHSLGRLGIESVVHLNEAALMSQVWNISNKASCWTM